MNQPIMDYTFLQNTTWRLKANHPAMRVKNIGKSVVGRSIYALELGHPSAPAVLFTGTWWGTDALSGGLLLTFMEHLLTALDQKQPIAGVDPLAVLRQRKIAVIPFVNPDGREICQRGAHCGGLDSGRIRRLSGGNTDGWKANARGVDIARNFDFCFKERKEREQKRGIYGAGTAGYSGPAPQSEPETVALSDYCRGQSTTLSLSFYPGKGEVYWRNTPAEDPTAQQLSRVLALCAGYDVEAGVGSITDTGFRNWFHQTTGHPAVDVMIGPHRPEQSYAALEEMLVAACLV